jgi:hypothetical protein
MHEGNSSYTAKHYFSRRDNFDYDASMFRQWFKKKDELLNARALKKRLPGGGRKPLLADLEEILADEVIELRILKVKVTRTFIADRARQLAEEHELELNGSATWVTNFLKRNGFSLRRMTNLTTLTDDQLIQRAVDYMKYLQNRYAHLNLHKTLLMDETAVYFEDARTQTVDIRGRRHVVLKSTGFASMRVTVIASVWADGRKAPPMVIHKAKTTLDIKRVSGPLLVATQPKGWVNSELLIKWIDCLFPLVDISAGKCIVWDSCRAHISNLVKAHCRQRNIELIVIPGGLTPYLQAGDIGIYREFKDKLSVLINQWKNSDGVEYTRGGNPKPPNDEYVHRWVSDAWRGINNSTIANSIRAAGFGNDPTQWHIYKHDVYGERFRNSWENTGETELHVDDFEEYAQENEVEEVFDE